MKARVALITGITDQDGAYLAELELKGYKIYGIGSRALLFNTQCIDRRYRAPHGIGSKVVLHYGDLPGSTNLINIIQQTHHCESIETGNGSWRLSLRS